MERTSTAAAMPLESLTRTPRRRLTTSCYVVLPRRAASATGWSRIVRRQRRSRAGRYAERSRSAVGGGPPQPSGLCAFALVTSMRNEPPTTQMTNEMDDRAGRCSRCSDWLSAVPEALATPLRRSASPRGGLSPRAEQTRAAFCVGPLRCPARHAARWASHLPHVLAAPCAHIIRRPPTKPKLSTTSSSDACRSTLLLQ